MLDVLSELVALDTVSPMSESRLYSVDVFLGRLGFVRGEGVYWVREGKRSDMWAYSHIDTKPPSPREDWRTDPWALTRVGVRLHGLGVSDAKFQLLNVLDVVGDACGVIVDGAEEIGGSEAARWLAQLRPRTLLVVDGASRTPALYRGTAGQLDGELAYDSGLEPSHPGRGVRNGFALWLASIVSDAERDGLHLNLTGVEVPVRERSLTIEQARVRVDIRYTGKTACRAQPWLRREGIQVRQHYAPLEGRRDEGSNYSVAGFSNALGNHLTALDHVVVCPGGLPDNGNHQPNEWIAFEQIGRHRRLLERAMREHST